MHILCNQFDVTSEFEYAVHTITIASELRETHFEVSLSNLNIFIINSISEIYINKMIKILIVPGFTCVFHFLSTQNRKECYRPKRKNECVFVVRNSDASCNMKITLSLVRKIINLNYSSYVILIKNEH